MNILLIPFFILLTVYGFVKKREYVLAVILVGQPLIKLMLNPFPNNINENVFLLAYFTIGFFSLSIIWLTSKKPIRIDDLTKKHLVLYLLFCLIILVSLIYSPDRSYAVNKCIDFFSMSFLIIFISIMVIESEANLYKTMEAIANISILVGIITVMLVYIKTGGIMVRLGTSQSRAIELFGVNFAVSIWFGRRMGIAFLAMLFITLLNKNKVNIVKTIILLIFVILSGSRGPILSMIITLMIIIFLNINKSHKHKKIYRKLFVFVITFLGIITVIILINVDNLLARLVSISDGNVISRLDMYTFSHKLIKENLLGFGIGSFEPLSYGLHKYPHNIILEILFELGIQGLIVFIIGVFVTIKRYLSCLKRCANSFYSTYLNFSFGVFLFALINAQFSGDIVSNEYIWFGFILMGRCIGIINEHS